MKFYALEKDLYEDFHSRLFPFIHHTLAWGNCVYEGKEFPERSTLKMINNIKECRTGRWEKIKISKEEEVCNLQDSYYPENTIVKTANDFRICKHKRTGYEWEVAHLNDATPKPETK